MNNFGRVVEITAGSLTFNSDAYTMEGEVAFNNDSTPGESQLKIWNLSQSTIQQLKKGINVIVNAGYKGDIGEILSGTLTKASTAADGVERVTTLYVQDHNAWKSISRSYAPGTLAQYIIRDLAAYLNWPIAKLELTNNKKYTNGLKVDGDAADKIAEISKECGAGSYISKNQLYVLPLRSGVGDVLQLSPDSGLIGSPEYFNDDKVEGYNITMQLQHRLTTSSAIDLKSKAFAGRLHVRAGSHKFSNTGDFTTVVEAII